MYNEKETQLFKLGAENDGNEAIEIAACIKSASHMKYHAAQHRSNGGESIQAHSKQWPKYSMHINTSSLIEHARQ